MEQYTHFQLDEGNIFDFDGGAIVVPSWDDVLAITGAFAGTFHQRIRSLGWGPEDLEAWESVQDIPEEGALYQAYLLQGKSYGFSADIILAAYIGVRDRTGINERVMRTMPNVFRVARAHDVGSLAIPMLGTGGEGGTYESIAPILAEACVVDQEQLGPGLEKILYTYGLDDFARVKEILDKRGY